jgi:hypothetical protein
MYKPLMALALALFSTLIVLSQSASTGAVSGIVRDATEGVVPGVSVLLVSARTSETRHTITDDAGTYSFKLLPPGAYHVEFKLDGFSKTVRKGVVVRITENVTVNETLQLGQQSNETISVIAQGEIVQANSTALGRVVDGETIEALPLATRNFTQITSLSPGTSAGLPDTLAVGNGTQNVYSNGGSQLSNSYTLNGTNALGSINSSAADDFGIPGVAVPSVDAIQEFKVQTSLYDASFGHKSGAQVNVVTRSGGSDFHGNFYEFLRNDKLNANNFFLNGLSVERPVLRQNQFGGTFGGPIVKGKTFFFVSYEGMRQVNGASLNSTRTLAIPEVPLDRSAASLGEAFKGQTGRRGGLAVDPSGSNINSVAIALLNVKLPSGEFLIPSPQRSGSGTNYGISIPAQYDQDQFSLNIDHELNNRNHLSGKYFYSSSYTELPFFRVDLQGFPSRIDAGNQNLTLSDIHIFGPTVTNEARLGYTRFSGFNDVDPVVSDAEVGMYRSNQDEFPGLPLINIAGAYGFGNVPSLVGSTTNAYSFSDTISFSLSGWGRHGLRIGTESRWEQDIFDVEPQRRGILSFLSFPDFLLGRPGGSVESGGNGTNFSNVNNARITAGIGYHPFRQFDQAFFIADDWDVSPRLTLNLGLRYEFLGSLSEKYGAISNFDTRLYSPPPPGGVTSAGYVLPENTVHPIPGVPLVSKTLLDSRDTNNFAPRIGLAYRVRSNGSLVVRAGYGVFYERLQTRPFMNALGYSGMPWGLALRPSGAANRASSLENPFPEVPATSDFPIPIEIPSRTSGLPLLSPLFIDPTNRTPYVHQYNVNIQQRLGRDMVLEVGYAGSQGIKLISWLEQNQAYLASPEAPVNGLTSNSAADAQLRTPYEGFTQPGLRGAYSSGTSNYNSLQASLTKRYGNGMSFLASYTFSKALSTVDTGDESNAGQFYNSAQDQHDIRGTGYGPQNFDRTHRFVFSYGYDLPSPDVGGIAEAVLGGWKMSGIVTIQSGLPFSVTDSRGGTLYGSRGSRASFSLGRSLETATGTGSTQSRLNQYFNTAAFVSAPMFIAGETTPDGYPVSGNGGTIFGDTGRNILRGPGQQNVDLALVKTIPIGETTRLDFRSEFFNLLNTANFANPGSDIASPSTFGVITATSSAPRVIQFGMKLAF